MIYSFLLFLVLKAGSALEEPIPTARAHFDSGNYAAAVNTLTAAAGAEPQNASVHFWLARSYYEMQNYDQAVKHAEKAVALAPKNAEYNRWLGRAYGGKAEQSRSFFLARKVKGAFETAVRLAPNSIDARRDLMQYCVEAPWIVGGDKKQARQQIEAISKLDPLAGRLARAAYLRTDEKWAEAKTEYLAVLAQHPTHIEPYIEAADFFADRNDAAALESTMKAAAGASLHDPRLEYYRAVSLVLRDAQLSTAAQLLKSYIANVFERSDYPSHRSAREWLRRIESKGTLENRN